MACCDYLLDKHVDQTYKAFHQMPLNRNLRTAWLAICIFVVAFWKHFYLDDAMARDNLCAVHTGFTGGEKLDDAFWMSRVFKVLAGCFFYQSIVMCVCQLYQVVAIYLFKPMLRYRMIVSRFNKLTLLFAAVLLVVTGKVRFSEEGKFCAGDHVSST